MRSPPPPWVRPAAAPPASNSAASNTAGTSIGPAAGAGGPPQALATDAAETGSKDSPPPARASHRPDPAALLEVIAELQAAGALDPATQRRLVDDLKQTDPSLWPSLLEYFKSSVTRQMAERAAAEAAPRGDDDTSPKRPPSPRSAVAAKAKPSAASDAESQATAAADAPDQTADEPAAPSAAASKTEVAAAESEESSPETPAPRGKAAARSPRRNTTGIRPRATPMCASWRSTPTKNRPIRKAARTPAARVSKSSAAGKQNTGAEDVAEADSPEAESDAPSGDAAGKDRDWRPTLTTAIHRLEEANREPPESQADVGRHAALRMLYLLAARKDDALKPIAGISPSQQDFWSQEVYGLATYLDTERNPETSRRAAEALERLREASARLSEQATLTVKSLAFCTEVTSFGVYKPFEKLEFKAGQEVLLYAEVDNFKSVRGEKGYRTALRSSYQVLDPRGRGSTRKSST